MNPRRRALIVTAVAGLLASGAGVFAYRQLKPAGLNLSELTFPDLEGNAHALKQWQGKTLLLNFWAPWCEPCRDEIPALLRVRQRLKSGLEIVGISLDSVDKVKEFAVNWKIDYPLLIGNLQGMEVMRRSGNAAGVLPYSVVLDPKGDVIRTHIGALEEAEWEHLLRQTLPMESNS